MAEKRFSRRTSIKGSIHTVAAMAAAYAASQMETLLTPDANEFGYIERVDDETRQKLLQFRPITVAHNGADDFGRLNMSIEAGVDFVEADVRQPLGRLIIMHSEDYLALAWNEGRRILGFSGTIPYVDELVQQIKPANQKLFLELKEDSFNLADNVIRAVNNNGLEAVYFAVNWRTLDRIYQKTERGDNLFYTVGRPDELELFLDQQRQYKRKGVSLNVDLATKEVVDKLHESKAKVLVAVVKKAEQAIDVLNVGVDGIVSGNLSVLSIWNKREPRPFFVREERSEVFQDSSEYLKQPVT